MSKVLGILLLLWAPAPEPSSVPEERGEVAVASTQDKSGAKKPQGEEEQQPSPKKKRNANAGQGKKKNVGQNERDQDKPAGARGGKKKQKNEKAAKDKPKGAVDPVERSLNRAIGWLLKNQKEDGSWGHGVLDGLTEFGFSVETYYSWKVAANALACMALIQSAPKPPRSAALDRGLKWLCATREPKRGSGWDVDHVWGALYGFVACVRAYEDPRFQKEQRRAEIEQAGKRFLEILLRNQAPLGGWGYYDDPVYSRRPKWATSFCTALALPALGKALEFGWYEDYEALDRARRYVNRCALPNGSFSYDYSVVPNMGTILGGEDIDSVKGGLGRTQVCNWALRSVGELRIDNDRIRAGLEDFFEHHRFLDAAFMRPVPHEAFYYNSGYFYLFGHYYAARAIELLPLEEREAWYARLRPHLLKVQRKDGSATDYLISSYTVVAGTSFLVLALSVSMPPAE